MRTWFRLSYLIPTLLVLAALSVSTAWASTPLVYIVHSYEQDHVCGKPQADGVISTLKAHGLYPDKVTIRSYYMDTKRTHTSPQAIAEQGRLAMVEIEKLHPKVVVTLDDNAFRHVGLKLVGRKDVSVVFSGLNGQPEAYDKIRHFMDSRKHPGRNVTGVYEKLHLKRALTVAATVLKGLKKVVAITDVSPTGKGITRQLEIESAEGLPCEWDVRTTRNFDEYKKLILELNDDPEVQAIYPVAMTLDDGGKRATANEIFKWTIEHSVKPEIPVNYGFCRLGLFGGVSVDFEYMGKVAGAQVSSILNGTPAGDLPIVDAPNYAIVFNLARANMLGITIPEDILLASDTIYKEMELLK
ncbi:hypothetical protein GM415_09310 [Pseudodesulfovibrio cashew]|uniref:ABC transporter substrate-binding protein n=1 Tax=Pseudodesulfovibrio cashew TaxID=2678688 RepID=A0A6I6JRS7_9BACT|nr:ABC transporter substrate binding protein [Pseudodesulfovibrio cashew]QGY40314.1 hypothetical protein GM415_09310 [Pseudodesulfovibrio cashew]